MTRLRRDIDREPSMARKVALLRAHMADERRRTDELQQWIAVWRDQEVRR